MNKPRLFVLTAVFLLMLGLGTAAYAMDSQQANGPVAETPPSEPVAFTGAPASSQGIQSLSGSFVIFDPSVGGDSCFVPGTAQTFCFRAESFSPDWEYVYNLWQKFPADWTVNNVYVQGTPACTSTGTWGTFGWAFQTSPYEVNISHTRFHANGGDHCTAFYCFDVTSGTGTPDALESWYWDGDGYNAAPHNPCSSDSYTPAGQNACDEAVNTLAAIPACVLPPVMLTPDLLEKRECACGAQDYLLTAWNNAGYNTNIQLTYTLVAGVGSCTGPSAINVPDGANANFLVSVLPVGQPGDTVVCEVHAEDAANPANNDTSIIVVELIAGSFDPAGWQLGPIVGATPNQWAGATVGTNPAASGPVGYVVGGLTTGSSILTPDLQMFDPASGTWTQLADLPNPRFSPVVGWINGLLYAAGGYDAAFSATADLQVYDPATDTWDNTTPADLPNIRGGGAGGVGACASGTGDCLFHVGGGPDGTFANTTLETWEYDPSTGAWTQLDNKPAGSSPDGHLLGAGVSCLGQVYVGGDYRGYHHFFRLDATQPSGSQWVQLADIPAGAGAMTPALVCKEDWQAIVLIGGDPDGGWGTYNNTVFVYDIGADTWIGPLAATLNVGQLGSVGWHLDNRVWTVGGTVGSGAITPMPFESLAQIICNPGLCLNLFNVWKDAPLTARNGDVISYTITLEPQILMPGLYIVDPLPSGVEYAGNLQWNMGDAWYSDTVNTVFWEYTGVTHLATPAVPVPSLPPDPAAALDLAGEPAGEACAPAALNGVDIFAYPDAVLWDNGPLVTHPGACSGMDASRLQTDLSMNTLGFGHQLSVGNRMADDFTITNPLGWQIDQVTFFAYQTGAPVTSTITGVYYQIWDGPPDNPASSVVFGDLATNRLLETTFTGIQRDSGTSPCANNRYIFADVASAGVTLPPGTYWLDWMTDGSLASGPWAPPITIISNTVTGNALQFTTSTGAWAPANDSGTLTQQGMPFIIEGEPVPLPEITFDVNVTGHCGDVIFNEGWAGIDGINKPFAATTVVSGDATIDVSPPSLEASLCPDATNVDTLQICNLGDCPLSWVLNEMSVIKILDGSMPFVPVDVTGVGPAPEGLTVSSPQDAPLAAPAAPVVLASPDDVLWDQPLNPITQSAWVDQEFTDFPVYSSFLADDFVNADPWLINSIFIPGDLWNGAYDLHMVESLTWQIYADNGSGLPDGDPSGGGNPPVWTLTLPPLSPYVTITPGSNGYPSNVTLNPPHLFTLPPGNWWLVFYPTAPFGGFGQYGRQPADTTNGAVGKFINPGGGFGFGPNWQDWTVLGITLPDIAFRLEGIVLPAMADIPWLSTSPITGTVPWGECQDVEVTFDASSLAPGDYTAELLIFSNDLAAPLTSVPVQMTVLAPVSGAAFTWLPLAPDAGTPVNFTASVGSGTPPFTYAWNFGDGGTGSGMSASHTYLVAGVYGPELTVANACGVSSVSHTLTVEPGLYQIYLPTTLKRP